MTGSDVKEREKDEDALEVYKTSKSATIEYIKFLLFPEYETPVRIPRLFPIPTHLWKEAGSASLTATSGSTYIVFSPKISNYITSIGATSGFIPSGTQIGSLAGF